MFQKIAHALRSLRTVINHKKSIHPQNPFSQKDRVRKFEPNYLSSHTKAFTRSVKFERTKKVFPSVSCGCRAFIPILMEIHSCFPFVHGESKSKNVPFSHFLLFVVTEIFMAACY